MAFEWIDKVDGVDDVLADDINNIANAVIDIEESVLAVQPLPIEFLKLQSMPNVTTVNDTLGARLDDEVNFLTPKNEAMTSYARYRIGYFLDAPYECLGKDVIFGRYQDVWDGGSGICLDYVCGDQIHGNFILKRFQWYYNIANTSGAVEGSIWYRELSPIGITTGPADLGDVNFSIRATDWSVVDDWRKVNIDALDINGLRSYFDNTMESLKSYLENYVDNAIGTALQEEY